MADHHSLQSPGHRLSTGRRQLGAMEQTVNTEPATADAASPCSYLVIHTVQGDPSRFDPSVDSMSRWRTWWGSRAGRRTSAAMSLSVTDLGGHAVFNADRAEPVTVVPLPAGTYHVLARGSGIERRYTLALDSWATFDLYVKLAHGLT